MSEDNTSNSGVEVKEVVEPADLGVGELRNVHLKTKIIVPSLKLAYHLSADPGLKLSLLSVTAED